MDNTCAADALLNVELAFAGLAVVTCGAGMVIASRPSAARRRALQAQTGAVGVDLISLNSPPWFMTKVEAASNRQQIIVDLSNRVDAAQAHGGEHSLPRMSSALATPASPPAPGHRHRRGRSCRIWRRARARASRPGQGGTAPSSQSFDLGQAPVQSESNPARGWITASWVGCSPNDRAQSTGRKRHVSLCSTGSCSTRSGYCQPYPGRRVRARSGWWRVPRRWRLPRRRRPSGRRSPRWSRSCRSRRRGSDCGYRGGYYPRRGYGAAAVGAAAVGAAAYGAYGAYNNCYDAYGNYICGQYRY